MTNKDDQFSEEETKRRAEDALRGAFKTPPVPHETKRKPPSGGKPKDVGDDNKR